LASFLHSKSWDNFFLQKLPLAGFDHTTYWNNVSSVAGGDDTPRPRRHGQSWALIFTKKSGRAKLWAIFSQARLVTLSPGHPFSEAHSSRHFSIVAIRYRVQRRPGLPDFSWYMIPKPEKMYQKDSKCTKWIQNVPNGHKICQIAIKYSKGP
jgi:hypothetical protein